jgi:alcohol dehydrogenase (cytochrome c)
VDVVAAQPLIARLAAAALLAAALLPPQRVHASPPSAAIPSWNTVDDARLLRAGGDDGWLMYRRSYDSHGFAPFDQINARNVAGLAVAFSYETGMPQGHEAAPIVNGRYMFVTTPLDHVVALDATNGSVLWTYEPVIAGRSLRTVCCDVVNRGVAVYGDMVYVATVDDRVIALDARTGAVRWEQAIAPFGTGYAMTSAPLVVKGRLIVGIASGEYGARGFIEALDPRTGALLWKHFTVPAAGEPGSETWPAAMLARGGGSTWLTGSFDPESNTLFWGVGNPSPWFAGNRPGTNLYTDSVLALDPASGALKWYFQFTPHDSWDYDGANENVLVDLVRNGKPLKALYHADRNGQFVVLDRTNGRFVFAMPFVKTTGITGYSANGVAIANRAAYIDGQTPGDVCPSSIGGKNWWPTSYSPLTGLAYVPTMHMCMTIAPAAAGYVEGSPYTEESMKLYPEPGSDGFGEVQAIDVATGARKWSYRTKLPWTDGTLATAGGLVFSGGADQWFVAFDAATGTPLWRDKLSSGIIGVPVSYRVAGRQYVAVFAGWGGGVSLFGGPAAEAAAAVPRGGKLYVFALPPTAAAAGAPSVPKQQLGFTPAQHDAGGKVYKQSCAACHGARLEGVAGPPLRADAVADAGTRSIGDLYAIASTKMPRDRPGSLSDSQYVSVVAYLLGENGYPSGGHPLGAEDLRANARPFVRLPHDWSGSEAVTQPQPRRPR